MTLEVIKDYINRFPGHVGKSLLQNALFPLNRFVKNCIAKKSSLQDRHPCVFFCTFEQVHPSALHRVSSPWFWNTPAALRTRLVCSHGHQLPWWQRSLDWAAPSFPPHAQRSPSVLPNCSSGLLPCLTPHGQIPGATGGRAAKPPGAPALGAEENPSGSSLLEVPTWPQLKCHQGARSFQRTVKQHLHDKTAALFPNQKLASLYGNCVPKR